MDPTTMPVSIGSENFCADGEADGAAAGAVDDVMATSFSNDRAGPQPE
jgi:hypothetical protein